MVWHQQPSPVKSSVLCCTSCIFPVFADQAAGILFQEMFNLHPVLSKVSIPSLIAAMEGFISQWFFYFTTWLHFPLFNLFIFYLIKHFSQKSSFTPMRDRRTLLGSVFPKQTGTGTCTLNFWSSFLSPGCKKIWRSASNGRHDSTMYMIWGKACGMANQTIGIHQFW